jgi:hypothetical protein
LIADYRKTPRWRVKDELRDKRRFAENARFSDFGQQAAIRMRFE